MTAATGATAVGSAGWASPENADGYAAFARTCGWYRELAADLVRRIDPRALTRVVDLCAGTGVLTRELLPLVLPACRILAIDSSPAMLARAVRDTRDGRVDWQCARAEVCGRFGTGVMDAVLCSAALWETAVPIVLSGVRGLLRPAGRFVFNLGPAAAPCWPMYEKALLATGFTVDNVESVTYQLTAGQAARWLSLPIFGAAVRSSADDASTREPSAVLRAPWLVVSASAGRL